MRKQIITKILPIFLSVSMTVGNVCAADLTETYDSTAKSASITYQETGNAFYADKMTATNGFYFTLNQNNNAVIVGCKKIGEKLVIPDKVTCNGKTYNVVSIGKYAFKGGSSALREIVITDGVDYIQEGAFMDCSTVKKLTLSKYTVSIGDYAFKNCKKIANINFPNTLQHIGTEGFAYCHALTGAMFSNGLTTLGNGAFRSCSAMTMVKLPGTLKSIGDKMNGGGAFYKCSALTNVTLGKGITTIGNNAFASTAIKNIVIPSSVKEIGSNAFKDTKLGSGSVHCEKGSAADNQSLYPSGTKIAHGDLTVAKPSFKVTQYYGGRDLTFNCSNPDAVIYYAIDSKDIKLSSKSVTPGTRLSFTSNCKIYAKAYYAGQWSNIVGIEMEIPVVKNPVITQSGEKVTIKSSSTDCLLVYTTDGSTPTPTHGKKVESNKVTIDLYKGTVKAIAILKGSISSEVVTAKVAPNYSSQIAPPSFEVKGVYGGRKVTFNTTTDGGVIYYAKNTSALRLTDKHVKAGGTVTFSDFYGTIFARTYKNNTWSNPAKLILKIPVCDTPSVKRNTKTTKVNGKTVTTKTDYVTISTSTPGCTLIYTTDGTTPSLSNGKKIQASSGQVKLAQNKTIKVIAVRSCFTNSKVKTFK